MNNPSKLAHKRVLIAGCGYVGNALGDLLRQNDVEVWGLKRDPKTIALGINPIAADLTQPQTLLPLTQQHFDGVVCCQSAGGYSDENYRNTYVNGLANLLQVLPSSPQSYFFLVSSTRVYHQNDGSMVDENSPTQANNFASQHLLTAEKLAFAANFTTSVVRLSGIYGPGRNRLIKQVSEGQLCAPIPTHYTNRIHRDDCAGLLYHLLNHAFQGKPLANLYLGVDHKPVAKYEVMKWLASQLAIDPATLSTTETTARSLAPEMPMPPSSVSGKRCSNRRILDSGYRFIYPDYTKGYGELLTAMKKNTKP